MENRLPKYHETFIPILQLLSDGKVVHVNELLKRVRDKFYANLPSELLNIETKSGDILILNRIAWGKAYLKQAKMVQQPERAMVQITEKGKLILRKGKLTLKEIINDHDFQEYRKIKKEEERKDENEIIDENNSPDDKVSSGFSAIEMQTKSELLEKLKTIDPYFFQKIVLRLFKKMGYGEYTETPKSNDGGIDGILNQDQLGIDKIYIQAKRYSENKVREPDIRNFIGAMGRSMSKGIFVTTSSFDDKAIEKASDASQNIILIDGSRLVNLMYEYGVGMQIKNIYEVKEIDEDFFEETNV